MTARDLAWRGAGLACFAVACVSAMTSEPGGGHSGLLCFGLALVGSVLMIQGRRVAMAWRIERSRHRNLVAAIRARRHRHPAAGRNAG